MKIISGSLKGRTVKGHNIKGTRPTMDRVKESIFSIIQNNIKDSICLDLFAGSGNLGIEAISRGSKNVYFNDFDSEAIKTIKENLKAFNIEGNIIKNDYKKTLFYLSKEKIKFDIIFLDPPYALNVIDDILNIIDSNDLLNTNGLIICEYDKATLKEEYNDIKLKTTRKYGDTKVSIYQRL